MPNAPVMPNALVMPNAPVVKKSSLVAAAAADPRREKTYSSSSSVLQQKQEATPRQFSKREIPGSGVHVAKANETMREIAALYVGIDWRHTMNHFMKKQGVTIMNGQSRLEEGTKVELKSSGGGGCKRKNKEVMDEMIEVGDEVKFQFKLEKKKQEKDYAGKVVMLCTTGRTNK